MPFDGHRPDLCRVLIVAHTEKRGNIKKSACAKAQAIFIFWCRMCRRARFRRRVRRHICGAYGADECVLFLLLQEKIPKEADKRAA